MSAQIVRNLYASFSTGNVPAVLAALDPQIDWADAKNSPYPGPFHGPDAVLNGLFMRLATEWDGFTVTPEEFVGDGETVVALGHYSGTCKATGMRLSDVPFAHVWKLRNGRVVTFRQHTDTVEFQRAIGAGV